MSNSREKGLQARLDQAEALTFEDFTGLDSGSKLPLQPHLQLSYPLDELVLAVHRQPPESDIMSNAVSEKIVRIRPDLPSMRRSRVMLAVHRFENSIYYCRIDHEALLLFSSSQQHRTLGEALETAFATSKLATGQLAAKIRLCFARAVELGWFRHRPTALIGVQ
jgi:hypothetical protein